MANEIRRSPAEESDLGCLRMLRGREWAIAASLGPDPAATRADECEVCMDTWLAGRVRVTLRRVEQKSAQQPSQQLSRPVVRPASRAPAAWRWQLVRAVKIDEPR